MGMMRKCHLCQLTKHAGWFHAQVVSHTGVATGNRILFANPVITILWYVRSAAPFQAAIRLTGELEKYQSPYTKMQHVCLFELNTEVTSNYWACA